MVRAWRTEDASPSGPEGRTRGEEIPGGKREVVRVRLLGGFRMSVRNRRGWAYWYGKADATAPGDPARGNGTFIDYAGASGNWGDRFQNT